MKVTKSGLEALTGKALSVTWIYQQKQHELYTSGCWSPYIQWIIFFCFIFYAANIKSLIDCRFPQDGQDLLYSYGVLAMMPISFLNTEDLVNYGCKEIEQLTTPENTIMLFVCYPKLWISTAQKKIWLRWRSAHWRTTRGLKQNGLPVFKKIKEQQTR